MTQTPCYHTLFKITISIFLCLSVGFTAACKPKHDDEKRDRMVSNFKRIKKVLKEHVTVGEDRMLLSQRLISVGINDENRFEIQEALQREFDMPIPFKFLENKETLGTIVRYTADYKGKKLSELNKTADKKEAGTKSDAEDKKESGTKPDVKDKK